MPFDWIEYLKLAHRLNSFGGEADNRSAISRAYYAAFCLSRNYALGKNIPIPSGPAAHKAVITYFNGVSANISTNLSRLRKDRNYADYKDIINFNLHLTAIKAIITAQKIIADLRSLP